MSLYDYNSSMNRFVLRGGGISPGVKYLLVANIAVYILQIVFGDWFTNVFGLSYYGITHGQVWQFFTYMFLHSPSNPFHLIFNMLMLFFMGPETERTTGTKNFIIMYLLSGLFGGVLWIALGYRAMCIGASGAIYGLLASFGVLWPQRELTLLLFFVIPIQLKAWMMVVGFAGIELLTSISSFSGGVAHVVHLAGAFFGGLFTWCCILKKPFPWPWKWYRRARMKMVYDDDYHATKEVIVPTEQDLNRILDKIAKFGIGSLTPRERQQLDLASRNKGR
ncbi:MAG: rhomboid family intramembrane serine protease [Spartobacteria bacterium]|nr:rhomboid family intramembrane serine protease [Spartobacteria bacterium]